MFYGWLMNIPADTPGPRVELPVAHLRNFMRKVIAAVEVDEAWYRLTNPDVDREVAAGNIASGRAHYIEHGYFEDRLPRPILVDQAFYLRAYEDIRQAIAAGDYFTAQQHFMIAGFREGRLPYEGFHLLAPARRPAK